jgi:hypothetical protein
MLPLRYKVSIAVSLLIPRVSMKFTVSSHICSLVLDPLAANFRLRGKHHWLTHQQSGDFGEANHRPSDDPPPCRYGENGTMPNCKADWGDHTATAVAHRHAELTTRLILVYDWRHSACLLRYIIRCALYSFGRA